MRARTPIIVALVLILGFILCLPLLELIDYDDLILTGQDLEISVLDLLTIFCVWFILVLRLFAFLPTSWAKVYVRLKTLLPNQFEFCRRWLEVLFLPYKSPTLTDSLPLLI